MKFQKNVVNNWRPQYNKLSQLNQLIKSNASQPVVRNKMGPTSVKQSKYDTEGTFNHPFG